MDSSELARTFRQRVCLQVGYILRVACVLCAISGYRQLGDPVFIMFHHNKPLEPFVKGKWSDFIRKVNVSVLSVLAEKER